EGSCLVTFTDSSKGLTGKQLAAIITGDSTSGIEEGSGSGLAVVRRMVDSLGGDISVSSEDDQAISIQLLFPTTT
ncbi:hypothetical protein GF356_02935, partial [candidate division GN15 bacterium]|nr:hypothetical protein [candidate division GN15 bacterium]